MSNILPSWNRILKEEAKNEYFKTLLEGLSYEYSTYACCPEMDNIFKALTFFESNRTKVVILGQNPYPHKGQADGLAFSVKEGYQVSKSLEVIFKEIQQDLNKAPPESGSLERWAKQGVLLLNTHLTTRQDFPLSHKTLGWEILTNILIKKVSLLNKNVVFMLWGGGAKAKIPYIDPNNSHLILTASHPSSSYRSFIGCGHFSRCNEYLEKHDKRAISW